MNNIIFSRKVNYYETDQMKVVHHSNYIRYFEEARTYFLEEIGYPYETLEELEIYSFVTKMNVVYKSPLRYGDEFYILLHIKEFTGVRLIITYEVFNMFSEILICTGESEHCFCDTEGKVLSLKRANTQMYDEFMKYLKK